MLTNGSVACWGNNMCGQLGYGNTDNVGDRNTTMPLSAGYVRLPARAVRVIAQRWSSCALLETGRVWCWGKVVLNSATNTGTLGLGEYTTAAAYTPVVVDTGFCAVDIPDHGLGSNMCALDPNRFVHCWGPRAGAGVPSSAVTTYYGNTAVGDDEYPSAYANVTLGIGPVRSFAMGSNWAVSGRGGRARQSGAVVAAPRAHALAWGDRFAG